MYGTPDPSASGGVRWPDDDAQMEYRRQQTAREQAAAAKHAAEAQENYRRWRGITLGRPGSPHPDFESNGNTVAQVITPWTNPATGQTVSMPDPSYRPKPGTGWVR